MKIAPMEEEGLREQSSTSAAPGRKFKVSQNDQDPAGWDRIRIPLWRSSSSCANRSPP